MMQLFGAGLIETISLIVGCAIGLGMLYFAWVSHQEEEPIATQRALILALLLPIPYVAVVLIPEPWRTVAASLLVGVTALTALILLLPMGNRIEDVDDTPSGRIDERDIMFSRARMVPGSEIFETYYERHPEKRPLDDRFRKRPGLLSDGTLHYDPVTAAAADASFKTVAAFHPLLDNETLPEPRHAADPAQMTQFIVAWLKEVGAISAGVTELRDYHLYSHIGRGVRYGEPVELSHKYAIAFTVEMNKTMLDRAPQGPTVMESAQEYLNSGALAVQLAEFLRQLGYSTRAHIDGSYRVVCPLVARDAGLGEIGRMGLLMTPELGPRVRLAVVTTDMPLVPNERVPDGTVLDFCRKCKKCADVCPSRSISFDDRTEIDGVKRWQIDSESCFTYWCTVGTDCGRCMSVCPYSHPDNLLHNIVRRGLKQSALFRSAALTMDDFFYGREPEPLALPDWIENVVEDVHGTDRRNTRH
jgi:ferredoxin